MSIKTSIGWCDATINPIKGKCKLGCWYCYYSGQRGMMNRFHVDPAIRLDLSDFENIPKKAKRIFLCSTNEIFGDWIPREWRNQIFFEIESHPQHTFFILTKLPQNIDRLLPNNVWIGVSVTNQQDADQRVPALLGIKASLRFVSIEPMFDSVSLTGGAYGPNWLEGWKVESRHDPRCDGACRNCPVPERMETEKINWVIVGSLTGYGHKYDPTRENIQRILDECRGASIPVFLKDNLRDIWRGELIQELPL